MLLRDVPADWLRFFEFTGDVVRCGAAAMLDAQTGEMRDGVAVQRNGGGQAIFGGIGSGANSVGARDDAGYGGVGGASRFFYCAKASSAERNAGLEDFPAIHRVNGNKWTDQDYRVARGERPPSAESGPRRNVHPTVKPIDLMRWLVRLVTPPGGTVLDPFVGSGTTGCAAVLEGFDFIGVEREEEYAQLAEARIAWWADQPEGIEVEKALAGNSKRQKVADTGQLGLLG